MSQDCLDCKKSPVYKLKRSREQKLKILCRKFNIEIKDNTNTSLTKNESIMGSEGVFICYKQRKLFENAN